MKTPLTAINSTPAARRPIKVIRPTQSLVGVLSAGLTSLLNQRNLLFEMTLLRLKVRYKQSLLGWGWAILPPLLLTVTFTLIFSKVSISTALAYRTGFLFLRVLFPGLS